MIPYHYVTRAEDLGQIANEIASTGVIGLDLETTPKPQYKTREGASFHPLYAQVRLCSINTGKTNHVIDLFQTKGLGPVREALHNPWAETGHGRPVVVIHNAKFDQRFLLGEFGIELWPIFCTLRASAILHNGKRMSHDLWSVQQRELGIPPRTGDLGGSDWGRPNLTPEQLVYAADDIDLLPRIREALKPKLAVAGLNRVAGIEFGAVLPEASVELNGFALSPKPWTELAAKTKAKRDTIARELMTELPNPSGQLLLPGASDWVQGPDVIAEWATSVAEEDPEYADQNEVQRAREAVDLRQQLRKAAKPRGRKDKSVFNMDSPDQLLRSLRIMLERESSSLDDIDELLPNTAEATLALLAKDYPVVGKLLKYRESATRYKSFGPEYLANLSPVDGRVHVDYYPLLVTGRYAHRNPNLGQIPRDKAYRACFAVADDRDLTIADYSNIEMVLMAEICGDRTLRRLFREGIDVHRYTGSKITKKRMEDLTKEERQQAKPANFGFIYGLGAEKFVSYALTGYGVTFTLKEATAIRRTFFEEFHDLRDWQVEALAEGQRTLKSYSIAGRVRHLDPQAHNEYFNNPVQSSGADGLKRALRNVYFRFKRKFGGAVLMVHHVHDEIVSEHERNPELAALVRKEQSEGMEEAMSEFVRSVPVKVEPSTGHNWADKA